MFGKGGLGGLMKQAQQMQERMQKMQEEIAQMEVTGESGAGLVKVTVNGAHSCPVSRLILHCWKMIRICWKILLRQLSMMLFAVQMNYKKRKWLPLLPECNYHQVLKCLSIKMGSNSSLISVVKYNFI